VLSFQTINSSTVSISNEYKEVTATLLDTVIKIDRNSDLGFNFPYYLRIPKGLNTNEIQYLLVETNNSGVNDTLSYHEKEAYLETIRKSLGSSLCNKLKVPFLIPVFPRPAKEWKIYTHAFDRDAASIKEGDMKRLDLQLIAMVENAKVVLKNYGINIKEKFLMNGFSASGTFANRFTLIHPTLVAGTACGGINAMPILCISKLEKTKLIYPIGTSDFKHLFGSNVDLEEYKKVPQFIYMGQNDKNDAVLFDDGYSRSERKIILKLLGKELVPERFSKCESIYAQNKVNSTFRVYPGIGHETDKQVFNDVLTFFNKIIDQK
jgi:predicted esterase